MVGLYSKVFPVHKCCSALRQIAVTAYFSSKQLLLFAFAGQYSGHNHFAASNEATGNLYSNCIVEWKNTKRDNVSTKDYAKKVVNCLETTCIKLVIMFTSTL